MSEMLYRQSEILSLLHKKGDASFNKASFSEAVTRGVIPFIMDGAQKYYNYDEVVKALRKAGIGHSKKSTDKHKRVDISKIENLPEPTSEQSVEDYAMEVQELGANPTLTEANIYKTLYAGKLTRLEYEKEMGRLIDRQEVEDRAFKIARSVRDKLMSVPERLSNEIASISNPHQIKELLYKEFTILLEGFADGLQSD